MSGFIWENKSGLRQTLPVMLFLLLFLAHSSCPVLWRFSRWFSIIHSSFSLWTATWAAQYKIPQLICSIRVAIHMLIFREQLWYHIQVRYYGNTNTMEELSLKCDTLSCPVAVTPHSQLLPRTFEVFTAFPQYLLRVSDIDFHSSASINAHTLPLLPRRIFLSLFPRDQTLRCPILPRTMRHS